jgi:hypothetical protein
MPICGRPTKLTPQTARTICRALRRGATRREAAAAANISYSTFNNWMLYGRNDWPGYFALLRRVQRAEAAYRRQWEALRQARSEARNALAAELVAGLRSRLAGRGFPEPVPGNGTTTDNGSLPADP